MARGLPVSTVPAGRGRRTTDSSVVALSILHARHLGHGRDRAPPNRGPADTVVLAAYLVSTQTPGFSALHLQWQLGLRRNETVWAMLQKLRRTMVRPEREPLKNEVEVDETHIGGREVGPRGGRHVLDNAIVVGAVEVRGEASGKVRLQVVPDVSARSLTGFVRTNVTAGAIVVTNGWGGYDPLPQHGYRHRPHTQGDRRGSTKILPRIHRVFANLKTWLGDTHHGVGNTHLQA
jgi:hypothetical protein